MRHIAICAPSTQQKRYHRSYVCYLHPARVIVLLTYTCARQIGLRCERHDGQRTSLSTRLISHVLPEAGTTFPSYRDVLCMQRREDMQDRFTSRKRHGRVWKTLADENSDTDTGEPFSARRTRGFQREARNDNALGRDVCYCQAT